MGVETPQCIHQPWVVRTLGSRFIDLKEHITIFKETINLKTDCRLNYLGTCDSCLKKFPYPRDSNWLFCVFTGETITNTNSSKNIRKKLKSFRRCPWDQEKMFSFKKRHKISWHCPFKCEKIAHLQTLAATCWNDDASTSKKVLTELDATSVVHWKVRFLLTCTPKKSTLFFLFKNQFSNVGLLHISWFIILYLNAFNASSL
jgi:hypothetical protein